MSDYLRDTLETLDADLARAGAGDSDGVHRARIGARRLRAAITVHRGGLAAADAARLAAELRWAGSELSLARDAHVVGQRLLSLLDTEPADLVDDAVRARIEATYADVATPDLLASSRFAALRGELGHLLDSGEPVLVSDPDAMRDRIRGEIARVRRRHDRLSGAPDPDVALHDLRKAAKRLRYAAEAWGPVGGAEAEEVERAAKSLTSLLGDRVDTIVTRRHLLDLASAAYLAGESTFTYGRLHAREQTDADALDAQLPDVWLRFERTTLGC